jgi:glycerol-3-phosphate acyltransferase PlsY
MTLVLWLLGAYLLGSIPTSYLAAKYGAGVDLRQQGSGNLGATNLYRAVGLKYAVPVGLFDVAKGAVPVLLAARWTEQPWAPLAVGVAAILGHVFTVFMRFKGGKGVATAAGVVLALAPAALGVSTLVWGVVLFATGYMSVASMLGAVTFPVAVRLLQPADVYTFGVGICLAAFIVYTHRSNIKRLVNGTENRIRRRRHPVERDA